MVLIDGREERDSEGTYCVEWYEGARRQGNGSSAVLHRLALRQLKEILLERLVPLNRCLHKSGKLRLTPQAVEQGIGG